MTVYREALLIGFRACVLSFPRVLYLEGPAVTGRARTRPGLDSEAGNRPEDPAEFTVLGMRGSEEGTPLAVAASSDSIIYQVAAEDLCDAGRQFMPDECWTIEDRGDPDDPLAEPV